MRSTSCGRRSVMGAVMGLLLVLGASGCGSDTGSGAATASTSNVLTSEASEADLAGESEAAGSDAGGSEAAGSEGASDTDSGADSGADSGDASGICGQVSVAEVNAAIGTGDFDTATDISVEPALACLYSKSTQTYGVTIAVDSLENYLAGEFADGTDAEALAGWVSAQELFVDGVVSTPVMIGDLPGTQVSGTNSLLDTPVAAVGVVTNGLIISVAADGLDPDPLVLGGYATSVLSAVVDVLSSPS